MTRWAAILSLFATLAFAWGAAFAEDRPWTKWQSTKHRDHPLAGKIWSAKTKGFVSTSEYADALREADIILLGENHDNPDHHRLQAWAVAQIAGGQRKGALIFEMIGPDEAGAIATVGGEKDAKDAAARLGRAVRWEDRGWPAWRMYEPIARAAYQAGFTIHAGDASQAMLREVAKEGFQALGAQERSRLGLQNGLDAALSDALLEELFDGHCRMLEKAKLGPMANVQRLRDATLADNAAQAQPGEGVAVLIAGNGHVRADRGVPRYLQHRADAPRVLSVMHVEVQDAVREPEALVSKAPDGSPAADFFWFTPAANRGDPCEAFRKMKKQ